DPPTPPSGPVQPVHDLGLRRFQPGVGAAQPAAVERLLRDVRLLVPGVVPGQPVRPGLCGLGGDDPHPGRRDLPLREADGAQRERGRRVRKNLSRTGYDVIGALVFAVMMFPIYWMVSTAFKPGKEILSLDPYWFPYPITLENFRDAIAVPFFWN